MKMLFLILDGLKLFFILPVCMLSTKAFNYFWKRYYTRPLDKNIFNLCVQWLLYKGKKYDLSYEHINVLIFCIIWPVLTILSLGLNIILLLETI